MATINRALHNTLAFNGANRLGLLTRRDGRGFDLQLRGAYSTLVRRRHLIVANSL